LSKVLVTGAGGFVGRPLCKEMFRRGYQVRAAMRMHGQLSAAGETVTVGTIDASTQWDDALKGVDTVIHLAARVHVMKDKAADPLTEFLKVNLYGTSNLARQAAGAGVKRLVFASSVKVNGEQTKEGQVFSENDEPDPQDPYAISKLQAEEVLQSIAKDTGLEVVIVRPPLVYGPGVKGNFFRLLTAIDKGIPLPLAGANNLRSLVYVGNLVDAMAACATHPAAAGQTYLVSDGEDVSTAMLVERISRLLGRNSRSFNFPPGLLRAAATVLGRTAQVNRLFDSLRVNDQKLRGQLGWTPPYTMEQGLGDTADWYRVLRNGYNRGTS
jgi:UDP-N-acetyl-alpha-D-quinovosamine dehydrogenase